MRALVIGFCGLVSLSAAMPALAAGNDTVKKVHAESVTGLPDFDCASKSSTSAPTKCEVGPFEVQVFPIKQVDGTVVACVAYFPYSRLKVHTTKYGEAVTLTWHLSDKGATFSGNGISVKEDFGDKFGELFDPQSPASGQTATLSLKAGAKKIKKFNHLPAVSLSGVASPCDGADPIISNSAD